MDFDAFIIILDIATLCSSLGVITATIKNIKSSSKNNLEKHITNTISPSLKKIETNIDKIQKELIDIKDGSDKKEIQRLRYTCLCFASDLRKGIAKTRQEYEEIFRMEDSYNALIDKYNIENGYMHEEMLYVHNQYRSLMNK